VADGKVRIGLSFISGVAEADANAIVEERERNGPYKSIRDLVQRSALDMKTLIESGACDTFGLKRRELLWQLGLVPRARSVPGSGGEERQLALPLDPTTETPELPEPTVWERMLADYRTTSLSVGVHPLELLRPHLPAGTLTSEELAAAPHASRVAFAGMVVARQRPATANGVVFMLLEDEYGQVNLIVAPQVYDRFRAAVRSEPLLRVSGKYEHYDRNRNVVVRELTSLGALARQIAGNADVYGSLPGAHHFGHR
jgi:error-prone DNA polymerase